MSPRGIFDKQGITIELKILSENTKLFMSAFSESDKYFMKCAFNLALKVKGNTFPNPAVGAVVVKNGNIVGRGATDPFGGPHAEKKALKEAGNLARGATLYVTLEPCNHFGNTSPCTQAIADAKIKKVIIATKDLNPLVNGKGIRFLRSKNITVSVGLMRKDAYELNEDFFWSIMHHMPWITVKIALTFDGRIADVHGDSKWITNKKSRTFVHDLRRRYAAIAVGSGTLKKDNPQLTVRLTKGKLPVRIVFSSSRKIGKQYHFRKNAKRIRSIIVGNNGKKGHKEIAPDGVELWYTGKKKASDHLQSFMEMAYRDGLTSVLVEGGQQLASSFLEHKLVNRLYVFYGNKLLGKGIDGFSFIKGLSVKNGIHLTDIKTRCFDDNVMITGIPSWE